MNKGIFCISIDLELLWGRKDLDTKNFENYVKKERIVIKKLLFLFKKYNIQATWATVGKLNEDGDLLWSGKDILSWIQKDKNQEIGSHSYSHEIFDKITKDVAENEIKNFRKKSFVFPRNKINYLNLLKKYGFKSYRAKDQSEYELLIPRIPPVANPKTKNGLIEIPSSMYFVSTRGFRKYIPYGLRYLKSKIGINKAIKNKQIFHIWFHPMDFSVNTSSLINEFEEILIYANKMRREGKLEIKNMDQTVKEFNLSKTV